MVENRSSRARARLRTTLLGAAFMASGAVLSNWSSAQELPGGAATDLFEQADAITLHMPLQDETRGFVNAEKLSWMKDGAVLINTARGGLVDENALKKLLAKKHLAAAAFDVFNVEPPLDSELLAMPNFLATPHIGGSAEEVIIKMGRAAINGLKENFIPPIDISQISV